MLYVTTQDGSKSYNIYYFHLEYNKRQDVWMMIGLARYNLQDTELVLLGAYSTYRQGLEVFSNMVYLDNEVVYYQNKPRYYFMPENNEGPIEIIPYEPDELVWIEGERYKLVLAKENYIENGCYHIVNDTTIEGTTLKI